MKLTIALTFAPFLLMAQMSNVTYTNHSVIKSVVDSNSIFTVNSFETKLTTVQSVEIKTSQHFKKLDIYVSEKCIKTLYNICINCDFIFHTTEFDLFRELSTKENVLFVFDNKYAKHLTDLDFNILKH